MSLPWRSYASTNVYYGSGFTNAFPGGLIRATICHSTLGLICLSARTSVNASEFITGNVANRRVELDNSVTFGGFHWNDPREIYAEFRYRFHY